MWIAAPLYMRTFETMDDTPQSSTTPQPATPEQQRRSISLPSGLDPRKAIEPAAVDRMLRAQAIARAQAQAASTVVISTIVSLVTSAFSFVAALAWNSAIQEILQTHLTPSLHKAGFGE